MRALDSSGRTSSIVGSGYTFRFSALFKGFGSMHSLILPFFLGSDYTR